MKKFIAGLTIGLMVAVGGTATAAELGGDADWKSISNSGVMCSVGKPGTGVDKAGVCVIVGGKWHTWSVSIDKVLGIKIENGHNQTMFGRGILGGT